MQSKLSKNQKEILIDLFFYGYDKVYKNLYNISSYNVKNHAINSLFNRGLIKKLNEGKYLKRFYLTEEGQNTAEELLLEDKNGFIIDRGLFANILEEITKDRESYKWLSIVEDKLLVVSIGNDMKNYHDYEYILHRAQGNGEIIMDNENLKIIMKIIKINKKDELFVVTINEFYLYIKTGNKTIRRVGTPPSIFFQK